MRERGDQTFDGAGPPVRGSGRGERTQKGRNGLALTAETIATGVGFTEGPVLRKNGELIFTSMSQGRLYSYKDGKTTVFAELGGKPNGATEGADGTIYVANAGGRPSEGPNAGKRITGGIQAVKTDGTFSWLTEDPVAPNDLCFGPDGLLYFTDPTRDRPARDDGRLWRVNVENGDAELLFSTPWFPNGIGFGADDALYVARSFEQRIVRFPLDGLRLAKEETYVQMAFGRPDGFLFDTSGNLIICAIASVEPEGAHGEIQTYGKDGKLASTFNPGPHRLFTNAVLGTDRTLYVTASDAGETRRVKDWPTAGLLLHPFRGK